MSRVKQLVILSGKGGTGKTSVTAAFAHLAVGSQPNGLRAVLVDADVDAANLELVLAPERLEMHEFVGGDVAVIDAERCTACGVCVEACRFDALAAPTDVRPPRVDPVACEGCAACVYRCPNGAISMQPQLAGHWFRSTTAYGPLIHAALRSGQQNSGKLVTLVKQQARLLALDESYPLLLVDGPPGIGCPVISAAAGADLALIVTEPTMAGIHDLARVLQTSRHFKLPTLVCINKADLYPAGTATIKTYCQQEQVELVGCVPFDTVVTQAMVAGVPVTAYSDDPVTQALRQVWARVKGSLGLSGA
jgi:MinD superfamily P-loop ATPase